jgi:hypothetical protein
MKKLLLATAVLASGAFVNTAYADAVEDPLHFTCATCLSDNGTFTPAPNGFLDVSVFASPAQDGTSFLFKELIPNNLPTFTTAAIGTITAGGVSTPFNVPLTLAQGGATWTGTSGGMPQGLEAFLGITSFAMGAPPNPIGAFLPSSQMFDPAATGFHVLTGLLNVPIPTLPTPGGTSPLNFSVATSCNGCWLLGDLFTGPGQTLDVTTAQSAALLRVPAPAAGAGIPGLFALGMLVLARLRRNRMA